MDNEKWSEAVEYLAYSAIGSAGYFALVYIIRPLRDRVNAGEKSESLADEILEVAL